MASASFKETVWKGLRFEFISRRSSWNEDFHLCEDITILQPLLWGQHPIGVFFEWRIISIMNLIVILLVLMLLFGGGGFYLGGPMVGGGGFGLILLICLVLFLTGRLGRR